MTKALILAVAAGLLSALPLYLAAVQPSGLLLLFLAPLPLFLSGLAQGTVGLLIAGGTLLVVVLLITGFDLVAAAGALLVLVGPSLLLVRQALLSRPAPAAGPPTHGGEGSDEGQASGPGGGLEWYPPGLLATWLAIIGLVWLAVLMLVLAGGPDGIQATLQANLSEAMSIYLPQANETDIAQAVQVTSRIALGAGILVWLLLLALNGILAQGALARFGRNLRPSPRLAELSLPSWPAPALALTLAVAFLAPGDIGFAAANAGLVLAVPFFFAGLAVVHAAAARLSSGGTPLLVLFYALLVILSWPALVVVLLGLFDQWAGLRRRLAGPGQEEK